MEFVYVSDDCKTDTTHNRGFRDIGEIMNGVTRRRKPSGR